MNKLTTFMNVSYRAATHTSGTPHFFNDTEFFSEFYSLVLPKTADFVDLGFNIGIQAELILGLTEGKIFGFEASKKIYDHATHKFSAEPRISLYNLAVSNTSGYAEFIDTDHWGAGSLNHTAGMDHCQVGGRFVRTKVELARLDDVLHDQNNIGAIKLDIEGAELLALDGGLQLIERNRPYMVMEYCHNALSFTFRGQPITSESLYHLAKEIGYKVYNIYGICLSNIDVWRSSILRDTADVYLIPAEKHEQWVEELLPVYQYKIYDKILASIEWNEDGPLHFALNALPSRIYETVNTQSAEESRRFIKLVKSKLTTRITNPDVIYNAKDLSARGKVLIALIHADKLDAAYRLACIKDTTAEILEEFQSKL